MDGFVVRNQTPFRLLLHGDGGRTLELAPLQVRTLDVAPPALGTAGQQAVEDGALAWEPRPPREVREGWAALVVLLAGAATVWAAVAGWQRAWWQLAAAGAALLLCGALLALLDRVERRTGRWRLRRGRVVRDADGGFSSWESARRVARRALHALLLLVVVAVGLAVPALAVWYSGGLWEVLQDVTGGSEDAAGGLAERRQALVQRSLQTAMIAVLVLMPALMFFWFDRERTETLLDRWLHHIFRFDPALETLRDVDAKHGRRLEEAYGTVASGVAVRSDQRARTRAPVVLATLLLALGWVLVLVTLDPASALMATDDGFSEDPLALFQVQPGAVSFAFLGAYVYALQVVLRGYVRGDLRPKTYNAISVRIVVAFVIAAVADVVLPRGDVGDAVVLMTAFLAGLVPDTVLRRLRDVSGWRTPRGEVDELAEQWPLTEIAGIDLYERTRLAEEGITNVQALAHCDVVALTLNTRIPFERVVHWVDQAVLHEHVTRRDRARLRRVGITTATALLEVGTTEREALQEALPRLRVRLLLRALARAEWVPLLRAWRERDPSCEPPVRSYPHPPAAAAPLDGVGLPPLAAHPARAPRQRAARAAPAAR